MHFNYYTTTITITTTILRPLFQDYLGEPEPEETLTHLSIILYLLSPSTMIHRTRPVQFTCLTVFLHNFCPSLVWSTSWSGTLHVILHAFLHPVIVFLS